MGNLVSSENDMKILKVEQGQAFIQEGDQVTVFSIESEHKEAAEEKPKESSGGVLQKSIYSSTLESSLVL